MPMDHEMAPSSTATAANNTPGAERKVSPWNKRPTPTRPRTRPPKSVTFMRHLRSATAEARKTQMGSLAMTTAHRPEGTRCSAQCSVPCPMRKKKTPKMALARHCCQVGRSSLMRHPSSRSVVRLFGLRCTQILFQGDLEIREVIPLGISQAGKKKVCAGQRIVDAI